MSGRRGVVLAGVLLALVALGAMAGALGFVALQEARLATNRTAGARASVSARGLALEALARFEPGALAGLAVGATRDTLGVTVRRLGRATWSFEATATDPTGSAERRAALLVHAVPPPLPAAPLAATALPGSGVGVDSTDRTPPGWTCGGESSNSIITSSIQLLPSDSALWDLGDWDWPRLAAWGRLAWSAESLSVRYAPGDLVLTGGRALGVLVVDGNLVLRAGVTAVGVVFVRGRIVAEGLGGTVFGVAVARGAELGAGARAGALGLVFSSCAAGAASRALAPLRPLDTRSLGQLR
jgi:hypothetical protein